MLYHVNSLQPKQIVERTVLDNGIVVITTENLAADIIATRIFIRAGSLWEPQEQAGLSNLLSAAIAKGTQQLSSIEIAEQVESVGAYLSADASIDYFLLSLKTVAVDWPEILQLAGQILRSPSFPEAEVELERNLTIQEIRSQKEQPFNIAFDQLRHSVYQNHRYGISVLGTEAIVSNLLIADLECYYQTYFRPDNMVISIAGRVAPEEALEQVKQVFGDWQTNDTPLPKLKLPTFKPQPCQVITQQDTQQSILMLGYLASTVKDADYATLKLLNTYLGNGLSSRLFVELREKRGLAYEVSAFYPTRQWESTFVTYIGTASENTETAFEGLRKEVERLSDQLLSQEELLSAKNKLLGQYALGKQTNAQLAQIYGWYETLGLGIEFDQRYQQEIDQVSPEMVQAVAQRYLTKPYVSLVGSAQAIKQLGKVVD
ncbi:MAG: insulinase family protein [Symploca sp. SIO2B6]|nr:insulinase family protein [Symploca sp. SIO2B6]